MKRRKEEEKVEEEILSIVEEGQEQGFLLDEEARMIESILEFDEKYARDIMTSRNKIYALSKDCIIKDVLNDVIDSSYSRFPVYDEDIDNIVGVIHFKDLVKAFFEKPDAKIETIIDKPIFVHPTFVISKLLSMMQSEKLHMAIVIDEYGQTDGIVTLEDIIEEIVGNIQDEHDEEVSQVKKKSENEIIVDGMMSLNDLSELLPDIEFPENDIETLSGFILYKLGHLPLKNERIIVEFGGYSFRPLHIQGNVIKLVRITRVNES